ncbi:uncharacterized membrane protein YebE (DUF533 family) [Rhodoligotrophos appendicifer]|uniref:tellurite resistance TerB family protein n=1 Tax=Rhodoligotrophos appendicifer TaxID=987056 RepID=UPI0011867183|nr:tellurite resistance TerB family protein [Rhodoligotrophos appendicifer]
MLDAQRLLEQFLGKSGGAIPGLDKLGGGLGNLGTLGGGLGGLGGKLGGLGGVGAAGGVIGLLLGSKGGRKLASNALVYGGMAALGGIAYKAYRDWQQSQAQSAPASSGPWGAPPKSIEAAVADVEGTPFLPPPSDESARADLGLAVIRAMIAAAKSDGHIDAEEQQRIYGHLDTLELGTEEKAFVMDELRRPLDIDAVVRSAKSPEQAAELYAASLLAVDPDDPSEKAYLAMLASRLKLDPALVDNITAAVAAATERA